MEPTTNEWPAATARAEKAVQGSRLLRLTCAAGADQRFVQVHPRPLERSLQLGRRLEPAEGRAAGAHACIMACNEHGLLPMRICANAGLTLEATSPPSQPSTAPPRPPTCPPAARRQTAGCGCPGCGRCAGQDAARQPRHGSWRVWEGGTWVGGSVGWMGSECSGSLPNSLPAWQRCQGRDEHELATVPQHWAATQIARCLLQSLLLTAPCSHPPC